MRRKPRATEKLMEKIAKFPVCREGHPHSPETSYLHYGNLVCGVCRPWGITNKEKDQSGEAVVVEQMYALIEDLISRTDGLHTRLLVVESVIRANIHATTVDLPKLPCHRG